MATKEESEIIGIKPFKTKFSRYALSLDRIFKNASLENLQQRLASPRTSKKNLQRGIKPYPLIRNTEPMNEKQLRVNFTLDDRNALKAFQTNKARSKAKKKQIKAEEIYTEPTFKDILKLNREEKYPL